MTASETDPRVGHFHAVQFYKDSDALCALVAAFLGEGLVQGEPAIIIAIPQHVERIAVCLQQHGLDVETLKRDGQLTILDAIETLAQFMADGMPNPGTFRHTVGKAIRQVSQDHGGRSLRAYGEMVNVLWRDGKEAAAIRLETLWNQLAATHEFKLLCGYSMGNFYKGSSVDNIKHQHSHLMSETGASAPLH